jgi:hypothetical protein
MIDDHQGLRICRGRVFRFGGANSGAGERSRQADFPKPQAIKGSWPVSPPLHFGFSAAACRTAALLNRWQPGAVISSMRLIRNRDHSWNRDRAA